MKITLTADGPIPVARYHHFRLTGGATREVVKLMGVDQPYPEAQLAIGGPGVERIRIGFHKSAGGNDIHVVMDLTGPRWMVTEITNVGSRLELMVAQQ